MPEQIIKVEEMNDAQQEQWFAILGLNRALFLEDPTLIPFKDTLEPSPKYLLPTRREVHADRGCVDGEVSILIPHSRKGRLASELIADGTPQNYERLGREIPSPNEGFIFIDLSHKPVRHTGEDKKTQKDIVILDNTVNYYHTRVKKLVNIENPQLTPTRSDDGPDAQFLDSRNFHTVERFIYSENPDDSIYHSVYPHEYAGELNIDISLQRLKQQLGYIAISQPTIFETRMATRPDHVAEALSA